jgi:RHS repeat-associated protein
MKKLVVFVIVFLLILFVSVNLTSANLFSDIGNFFGKVTGNAISVGTSGESSVKTTTYLYAGTLVASKSNDDSETQYYIQDHLGSNMKVLDNGVVEQNNSYYAFGETNSIGASDNNYKYTGKELDDETGLYYYGSRYYAPEIGRFVQADVRMGNIKDPLSMNRYVYTKNNPLKYIDPTGNEEVNVNLINMAGQTAKSLKADNANEIRISMAGLASGNYIVQILGGEKAVVQKRSFLKGGPDIIIPAAKDLISDDTETDTTGTDTTITDTTGGNGEDEKTLYTVMLNLGEDGASGSTDLTWTAPGDDGRYGTASSYTLFYSDKVTVTSENYKTSPDVHQLILPIAPDPSGTKQKIQIIGLIGVYHFALTATDEAGNEAVLSNVVTKEIGEDPHQPGENQ